jgi:hypothetical protein
MFRPSIHEAYELNPTPELRSQLPKSVYSSHYTPHSTASQPRKRKHGEFTGQVTEQHDIGSPFKIQVEWSLEPEHIFAHES